MAIIFNQNIQNLWCAAGILRGGTTYASPASQTYTSIWAITIFSGAQPSAATITSSWSSYNTVYLCHWQNVTLYVANADTSGAAQGLGIYSAVSPATANASGTASWAILWPTNPTEATIQSSSLPSTQFIVCTASDNAGTGIVRLASTTILSGNSYTPSDVVIVAGGGIA